MHMHLLTTESATCASDVRFVPSLFTGKERDAESGNDYFEARYNGSSMGRMLSPDPVGGDMTNPQSLNKYAYALNNPLRFTDPTGLYVCKDGQDCSAFGQTMTN